MNPDSERTSIHFSRRSFLAQTTVLAAGLGTSPFSNAAKGAETVRPLNRFPRMVQEYFVKRVRSLDKERTDRVYQLSTRQDAENYVAEIREKIRQSFGPEPERTALNPRITKIVERDTYRIENVIFESRPGFLVTANLYVPREREGLSYPRPGVIGTCGHSSNGKAEAAYQSFAQGLARQGYVVLIYDPIGQGERLQYPDKNLKSKIGVGVREHLYAGNQQFLVGEFIGAWRAWDGIRALDYLLTRKEVDPNHLGVTGNSGGGTMTTWLAGVDPRYTMAAPSCFVTSFRRNLENELPADTEQCPPKALALGLDHEDFLAALAPKPVMILSKERDYFDVRGSEAALARLKHLYRLLGAEDKIALFTGPTGHGYSQENREAMYGWFNKATGTSLEHKEPTIKLEADSVLEAAPKGQVATLDSLSVHDFTQRRARELKTTRGTPRGTQLKAAISKTLKLETAKSNPDFRILRSRRSRDFPVPQFTTYAIETEPGIHAIAYLLGKETHHSRPPKNQGQAALYVSHLSSDSELRNDSTLKEILLSNPDSFYACDVRGTGESQPDTCGENSFLSPYGSDYFYSIHSLMLDDPYPGQKTRDLIQVIRWLQQQGHQSIHLVANGRGSVPGAIASLLSPTVRKITLINALHSFQDIAEAEEYDWPLSTLIPNALQHFDLTDVYADLQANRELVFLDKD